MNKNIKLKVKKHLKSIASQIWANKFMLAYMTAVVVTQDTSCFANASEDLPWGSGLNKFYDEITGPMAATFSGIAIAGGGAAYVFGTSQLTQIGSKVALGAGVATGAPTLLKYATNQSGGCLF